MEWNEVKNMIRAVCTSMKGGVPLEDFYRDYMTIVGSPIPFKSFGYSSLEEFLSSLTDVIRIEKTRGVPIIKEIPTAETAHMSKLVAKQKSEKKPSKAPVSKLFKKNVTKPRPVKIQRTIYQDIPSQEIKSPVSNPITYVDNKNHNFEVPVRFQPLVPAKPVQADNTKQKISKEDETVKIDGSSGLKKELKDYLRDQNLIIQSYKTVLFKMKQGVNFYCCTIKIGDHLYSTYPSELKTQEEAEELAAQIFLEKMKADDKIKYADTTISMNNNKLFARIIEILGSRKNGVFNFGIEKEYLSIYEEKLPNDWLDIIDKHCKKIEVQRVDVKRSILVPVEEKESHNDVLNSRRKSSIDESPSLMNRPSSSLSDNSSSSNSENLTPSNLTIPTTDTFDVFVTRIINPKEIMVRLADYSIQYEELANDMDIYYMDNGRPASSVEVNKIYAAKVDASWLRVGILSFSGGNNQIQCIYLDHGEEDYLDSSKLYVLENQFRHLPYQALKCHLFGLDDLVNDNNAYLHLIEMAHGKTFVAQIVNRSEPISVILYDTSTEEDVNINDKLVSISCTVKVAPDLPKVGGIKEVFMCHINEDGEFFINIESSFYNFLQDEIANCGIKADTNEECINAVNKQNMYLAKYEVDMEWYRAVILDVNHLEQKVKVQFIDYGNIEWVPLSSLRDLDLLSDSLSSIPAQAIPCILHSLPPDGYKWTSKAVEKLATIAPSDEPLLLKVIARGTPQKPAVVEIFKRIEPLGMLASVNTTLLVSLDLFEEISSSSSDTQGRQSPRSSNGSLSLPSPLLPNYPEIKISSPSVPMIGEYFDLTVKFAANPFNFICQPWQEIDKFNKLMANMQTYYNEHFKILKTDHESLRKGMFFVAKHSDDQWSRVLIKDIVNQDPIMASVYYIDFGDYDMVSKSGLLPLRNEFCELPYMAIHASLQDVKPRHGDWSPMDCVKFQKMVVGREFVSIIKEKSIDSSSGLPLYKLSVSLIDTSIPEKDTYIAQELKNKLKIAI